MLRSRLGNSRAWSCAVVAAIVCGSCRGTDKPEVPPSPADEALRAARAGNVDAAFDLAVMWANESQDAPEAASLFRRAAQHGHAGAANALGFVYWKGRGVPQDKVEALTWLTVAVIRSTPDERDAAQLWRDHLAREMTSTQIAEAEGRAQEQLIAMATRPGR